MKTETTVQRKKKKTENIVGVRLTVFSLYHQLNKIAVIENNFLVINEKKKKEICYADKKTRKKTVKELSLVTSSSTFKLQCNSNQQV